MMIPVWFVPSVTTEEMRQRTGNPSFEYEISCAQLCGLGHYRMRGYLHVQTPEAFDKWLGEQAAQAAEESVWQ
jgi:cytochrome c oxidase subunit 2